MVTEKPSVMPLSYLFVIDELSFMERTVTALDLNNGLPFVLSHRHGLLDGAALRELPRQTSRLGFAGSKF